MGPLRLPCIEESPTASIDDLLEEEPFAQNHASFDGDAETNAPAHSLLQELVDGGFAIIFRNKDDAEHWPGSKAVVSPLGDVTKPKPDGGTKHRLIQDLRASRVNEASVVSERQVLPRFKDHASDLASASCGGQEVRIMILDFSHAFMTAPLHEDEMRMNCTAVPGGSREVGLQ